MQELHYLAEYLFIPIIIITYFIVPNKIHTLHVLAHYLGNYLFDIFTLRKLRHAHFKIIAQLTWNNRSAFAQCD